jgi:hypothetical protein
MSGASCITRCRRIRRTPRGSSRSHRRTPRRFQSKERFACSFLPGDRRRTSDGLGLDEPFFAKRSGDGAGPAPADLRDDPLPAERAEGFGPSGAAAAGSTVSRSHSRGRPRPHIKGAGLGERPRAAPAPLVDAFVWVKVPGQADGTANKSAARFDPNCASDDATPGAPEAGEWFEPYLIDLVKNANPPL